MENEIDLTIKDRDLARYNEGIKTAAVVGTAMSAFKVAGEKAGLARPLHNEMPAGIVEKPNGDLMFMFKRCLGHWSGHGVRIVDLEFVTYPGGVTFHKVTGDLFLSKPSPPPPSIETHVEPFHFIEEPEVTVAVVSPGPLMKGSRPYRVIMARRAAHARRVLRRTLHRSN